MRLNQQNQVSKLLIPRDPTPEQKTEQRADHSKEQLKDNISRKSLKHSQKSQLTKLVNNPKKRLSFEGCYEDERGEPDQSKRGAPGVIHP